MSYFQNHYEDVRYPIAGDGRRGLRRGQLGAIHAVAAHFTLHKEPAVVVMPTGVGKTAVLMLAAYLLQANRALVLTPSRLVRSQIVSNFRTLKVLRETKVFQDTILKPNVHEVSGRLTTPDSWTDLEQFDIVVGTPFSVSPAIEGIAQPPADLFDLVLIDEAHHSPAKTWNDLMVAFPEARRVLFTATPFRSDQREIKGRFVYTYPVADAYKDGVFGQIEYLPVNFNPKGTDSPDVVIAKEAERVFREDRAAGFKHFLMVRTDIKKRATELEEVYQKNTGLKLQAVHSGYSYRTIQGTIRQLEDGELDGIICVSMLGEGFDFPNLKIAAVHAPHKSLAVTLQFIGRFARTNAPDIGTAKFLAVPSDISIEAQRLYEEGAIWQTIVPGLLETQVQKEVRTREVLSTFTIEDESDEDIDADLSDLSMYGLRPYHHVKVYEVDGDVKIDADVRPPKPLSIVRRFLSTEYSMCVFITMEVNRPRWAHSDLFAGTEYALFIVHYNTDTKLLFICASRKSDVLYENIVRQFVVGKAHLLPLAKINKAHLGLRNPEFYNVGMRNRLAANNTESYRTYSGSKAHKGIKVSDGRLYHPGHSFGRATEGMEEITIGLSSSSKIWSNTTSRIPDLLDWCEELAKKLSSDEEVVTHSELDRLRPPQRVNAIPEGVIAADWPKSVYLNPPTVLYRDASGQNRRYQLLDLDLAVDSTASNKERIRLAVCGEGLYYPIDFSLCGDAYFAPVDDDQRQPIIEGKRARDAWPLLEYINAKAIEFYFADFSSLVGHDCYRAFPVELVAFDKEQIEVVDWDAGGVDIQREYGSGVDGKSSIHDYLKQQLLNADYDVVFYDHGSGEIADYIAIKATAKLVQFEYYHCKGSKEPHPGDRVEDIYEVCGQVIKSLRWIENNNRLFEHVRRRSRLSSSFVKGDISTLEEVLAGAKQRQCIYQIVAVQPAVSRAKLSAKLADNLAGANDYIIQGGSEALIVLGSS